MKLPKIPEIGASKAWFSFCAMFLFGYIWSTFFEKAPWTSYAEILAATTVAYWVKRSVQKLPKFQTNGGTNAQVSKQAAGNPGAGDPGGGGGAAPDVSSGQQKD